MSGEPLTYAQIQAMSPHELAERAEEIRRWAAAGAIDGQPAPPGPHVRPEGHRFTQTELDAMSPADINLNRAAILRQVDEHGRLPK